MTDLAGREEGHVTAYHRIEPASGFVRQQRPPRPTDRQIIGHLLLTIWLIAAGVQAGYFGAQLLEERYEAVAEIEYRGRSWTETQDVAIRSRTLTLPVAQQFDVEIRDFEENLGAGLVPGTQILRLTYRDPEPAVALDVVTVLTDRYVAVATELPSPEARAAIEASLADLRVELDTAIAALEELPDDPAGVGLTIEQQTKQSEIATLRSRIGVLELRILDEGLTELNIRNTGVPRITTEPFVFEEPVEPRPVLMGTIGGVVGMLIGVAILTARWARMSWRHQGPSGA